ncbi:sensor histidine kinase [Amycolatopsis kentuckyensis]|uniref:sensor histidine kinase n=1 Tax=Amycolatopsis kentuckyensis TaxID=218823 RepID=UPI000A3CF639|nr:sensor histidine kinase [Amycolatopsis kentuckyensis]
MERLSERLRVLRSPLVATERASAQLRYQLGSVLDDAEHPGDPTIATDLRATHLADEIGTTRAMLGVHPVESVRVAIEMFEVLLPVVVREVRANGGDDAALCEAAGTLEASIMRRVGLGAVSYASYLLKKVNNSHRDERNRIARELHDRVAHSIGVAMQELELHEIYVKRDSDRARKKISAARALMEEALTAVRETAQELHGSASDHGGLRKALADYAAAHVPSGIEMIISLGGDLATMPPAVSEELYIVLREAIRNAVQHASPRTIRATVEVRESKALAKVEDDGCGFDVAMTGSGIGLLSMSERVELLDGDFMITSTEGSGTTVSITIPVSGAS